MEFERTTLLRNHLEPCIFCRMPVAIQHEAFCGQLTYMVVCIIILVLASAETLRVGKI